MTGFGYAIDDSSLWSPYSDVQEWPPGDDLWLPTVGIHTFFVRLIDAAGAVRVLAADLNVLAGPQECAGGRILVVLDSDPDALVSEGFLPEDYETVERALVDEWFAGYSYEVFETSGMVPPSSALLDCATSLFWFHSTLAGSDPSVLKTFHAESPNPLQSYVAAAGNLFVCGFQPSFALRYFENRCGEVTYMSNYPLHFSFSLTDPTLVPHWAALRLGVDRIDGTVGNTYGPGSASDRLSVAVSAVTGGATPYPDLPFDPLTWPDGAAQGGFGFYDRDFVPIPGAEVVYEQDATGRPIGLRRSASPGVNGNVVVLGFHPYFVERPAFRALLESVLSDFGEAPPR